MIDTLVFFLLEIVLPVICIAGAVIGVRVLRAMKPSAPPRIHKRPTPPPVTIEANDDFVPDEEVECIGDVRPGSESVKAKVSSDGTISLIVPEARSGTAHEKPVPAIIETGTAYEIACRGRRCRFRWRLPGLHKKAPKNFRCPACKGYSFTTKAVFHVTKGGRVKLVKKP